SRKRSSSRRHRPDRPSNDRPPPRPNERPRHHRPPEEFDEPPRSEARLTPAQLDQALQHTSERLEQWMAAAAERNAAPKTRAPATSAPPSTIALDPWQSQAVEALLAGNNVVVDAPTTAGKTRVVESFFQRSLDTPGFRACYTCPVKSLSNDK